MCSPRELIASEKEEMREDLNKRKMGWLVTNEMR